MAVPVNSGNTGSNETTVFIYLTSTMKFNKAVACGILANIEKESSFNPQSYNSSDPNGGSFGICQWNGGRWTALKNYCSRNNLNATTIKGQLAYMNYELSNSYGTLLGMLRKYPNTQQGCWDAAAQWCARFEVPAGYGSWDNGQLTLGTTSKSRGDFAVSKYWSAYSGVTVSNTPATDKGALIVAEARKYLGTKYVWGGVSPEGFDCSGFVYYVYRRSVQYNWPRRTAFAQYKYYGRSVKDIRAGDLVFFTDTYSTGHTPNVSHVGIFTGNDDEFIHCSSSDGVEISTLSGSSYWNSHYYATKRILNDAETLSQTSGSSSAGMVGNISSIPYSTQISDSSTFYYTTASGGVSQSQLDTYSKDFTESLRDIEARNDEDSTSTSSAGYLQRYGYLVDLVNGGEFKFPVPEYDVGTQANWESISILGRSVDIKGYTSTSSKSVKIDLDLIAGIGAYTRPRNSNSDVIQDLHDDIAFVESLAYPDYSSSIALPPPVVLLYLGPTLKMRGIISDINVSYLKPYATDLRPMHAKVSFTVTHITDSPPDYADVRNHKMEGASTGLVDTPIEYNLNVDNIGG